MTAVRWLAMLASAVALTECAFSPNQPPVSRATSSPSPAAIGALTVLANRPMRLPHLAAGPRCPQAALSRPSPDFGYGLGDGPVYAIGAQGLRSALSGVTKVLWAANPIYTGPIRIRGGQLDGPHNLLLESSSENEWKGPAAKVLQTPDGVFDLDMELDFQVSATSTGAPWRNWPSYTYVGSPGCYAWQIDGVSFTELIEVAVS